MKGLVFKMDILRLQPAYKDYIWGGQKLKTDFGKQTTLDIVAESWELSCHADGESIVADGIHNGKKLSSVIKTCKEDILGSNCNHFDNFPILIKFIDANEDLSVQVHPDDDFALKNEGQYGKTEMWYVADCDEGAYLFYGVNKVVSRDEFIDRIEKGTLTEVLNKVSVKKGDSFFIQPGTIHSIGKGIVIAEIQQNSNLTYRIYDYNRHNKEGIARELHIEKALKISALSPTVNTKPKDGFLVRCKYFSVMHRQVNGEKQGFADSNSFHSLLVINGNGQIQNNGKYIDIYKGDSIFIPAGNGDYSVEGECEILLTCVGVSACPLRE